MAIIRLLILLLITSPAYAEFDNIKYNIKWLKETCGGEPISDNNIYLCTGYAVSTLQTYVDLQAIMGFKHIICDPNGDINEVLGMAIKMPSDETTDTLNASFAIILAFKRKYPCEG